MADFVPGVGGGYHFSDSPDASIWEAMLGQRVECDSDGNYAGGSADSTQCVAFGLGTLIAQLDDEAKGDTGNTSATGGGAGAGFGGFGDDNKPPPTKKTITHDSGPGSNSTMTIDASEYFAGCKVKRTKGKMTGADGNVYVATGVGHVGIAKSVPIKMTTHEFGTRVSVLVQFPHATMRGPIGSCVAQCWVPVEDLEIV